MNRLADYPVHGTCSKCLAPCRATTDDHKAPGFAWVHVDPTSHKPGMRGVKFILDAPVPDSDLVPA